MPDVPTIDIPEDELSPEERDRLIGELASRVVQRGMVAPAVLFLEMHKPLAFIAGQSMLVASPFLSPIIGLANVRKYSCLFGSRENVELLIQRIEEMSEVET